MATQKEILAKLGELNRQVRKSKIEQQRECSYLKRLLRIEIFVALAVCLVLGFFLIGYAFPAKATPGLSSENLMQSTFGGRITTWVVWKVSDGQIFHISVEKSPELTGHRMKMIQEAVFSNKTISEGNSVYYAGWDGALKMASISKTLYPIPTNFHISETTTGTGNILIKLTDSENPQGYTGLTRSIADPSNHEILKSEITIYGTSKLNDDQFARILRHELGHAFGIEYSDDPNDIMHLTVKQDYISNCDITAISSLYNGNQESYVRC